MTSDSSFDGLLEVAANHRQVFGRSISCELYRTAKGYLGVSRINDDIHDVSLAMLVDDETHSVVRVCSKMECFPFVSCLESRGSLRALEGLNIFQSGVLKEVRRRMPDNEGCTHLTELFESIVRALSAHGTSQLKFRMRDRLSSEERRQLHIANPSLRDRCRTFRASDQSLPILERARRKVDSAVAGDASNGDDDPLLYFQRLK